jgi:hypothetical protein
VDVYLLETLISLRDGGDWIADLDIFNTIGNMRLRKMSDCQDYNHNSVVAAHNFTAIDNWLGRCPKNVFEYCARSQKLAGSTRSYND